jgi:peptidoglycan hydrolase-like protein with peptidoglycan-binding domain
MDGVGFREQCLATPARRRLGALAAACVLAGLLGGPGAQAHVAADGSAAAIEGRAVWIWDLRRSAGGDPAAIAAQARASGVRSVFIKAADGAGRLSQFNAPVVAALRARGLYVCAWQYVYGRHPMLEAAAAVAAVRDGAQCLIVDAEAEYDGRYWAAQTYLDHVRAALGGDFPLALASFPYVRLHPGFPYSVFLGPGGAQFDLPQMYWQSIGASIDSVFANTFVYNRIYGRTIVPVGEMFGSPSPSAVVRFRDLTVAYGAPGISWWDWAWVTDTHLWAPLSALLTTPPRFHGPDTRWPDLREGSRGDDVLWLQEHLARAFPAQRLTGLFAGQTHADLESFQRARGLAETGRTGALTWKRLLALAPVAVRWQGPGDGPIDRIEPTQIRRSTRAGLQPMISR